MIFAPCGAKIIFARLIYPTVALLAAALALGSAMSLIIFPLAGTFSLLGPLIAIGFYELARHRKAGMEARWSHFLNPLRDPNRAQILGLAAYLVILALAWLLMAKTIYNGALGILAPTSLGSFLSMLFTTPQGWRMIVMGNIVGLAFALVTLMTMLVSFPMMVDKPTHASNAVISSLRWGINVARLLALACIPLFLRLAIVLPVLGYASWHLYTRLVER